MEFATEMIIKAANFKAKTVEVPITLHKDGRIQHPPHLRTIRDGWKTLQFFLICAPSKLFLIPGLIMCLFGILGGILGYLGSSLGPVTLVPYNAGFFAFRHQWLSGSFNAFVVVGPFPKTCNEKLGEQHISSETHNVSRGKDMFTPAIFRSIPMGQSLTILAIN